MRSRYRADSVSDADEYKWLSLFFYESSIAFLRAEAHCPLRSMALAKFLKETYGKQSVLDAVKAGGWKAFLDGTLA